MRLVFVDNLLFQTSGPEGPQFNMEPHLGLMSLVAVARSEGHQAEIVDPKQEFAWNRRPLDASAVSLVVDRILARQPDVVGFTALACNFVWVSRLAQTLRARAPDMRILLGGPHASILHTEILETLPAFDVVVRHEAEETLPGLLARLPALDLRGLAGVSYRDERGRVTANEPRGVVEDLDRLPMPAFDCYPLTELGEPSMRIDAGRGCPFSCTFCSTATFFGRSYRLKTPARLLAEMDLLRDRYGFTRFKLNHDLFTVDRRKVSAFCDAVLGKGYTWSCSARVDCVDPELLEHMHAAGCRGIYFGIETGSARMQRVSAKRLDLTMVAPTIDVAERLGMTTTTSFIVGFPEEERDDQRDTIDMAGHLHARGRALNASQVHLLAPEPGTALIAENRARLAYDAHISTFNVPPLDRVDEEAVRAHPTLFASYWYFRGQIAREDSIFTASAWVELEPLDRSILAQLIAAFDGSLYRLIEEARELIVAECARDLFAAIVQALALRYGSSHHLVSLARYVAAMRNATRAARSIPVVRRDRAVSEEQLLCLSPRARVLSDIHDVPRLIEQLKTPDPLFDVARERTNLVIVAEGESEVSVFRAGEDTAALLSGFGSPTSYWGYCAKRLDEAEALLPDWEDIRALFEKGVLEAAEPLAPAARSASSLCVTA